MGNSVSDVHVIIVGSGYAGVAAARYLDQKCRVTVIEPSDTFNHKIASLRGTVVPGWEKRSRIPLDKVLNRGKIIQSEVKSVETGRVTLTDNTVMDCDYVILAHGQGRANFPCDFSHDAKTSDALMEKMRSKQKAIANAQSIVVVGGGPVGVEFAGEIVAQHPTKKVTIVHRGDRLLNNTSLPLNEKALGKLNKRLLAMGVEVKLNCKLADLPALQNGDSFIHDENLTPKTYTLSDNTTITADMVIVCVGSTKKTDNLVPVDVVDDRNQVKVNSDLQVVGMERVFCVGDANNIIETKMAYFAGQQAVLAAKNILLKVSKKSTISYTPMDGNKEFGVMLIPLGPQKGVVAMGNNAMGDRAAALFKGKGLFVKRYFSDLNASVPPL